MKRKMTFLTIISLFIIGTSVTTNITQHQVKTTDIEVMVKAFETVETLQVQISPEIGGGSGNSATCYSTYQEPGFLSGSTNIFVCGTCKQVKAKLFSDPGTCSF